MANISITSRSTPINLNAENKVTRFFLKAIGDTTLPELNNNCYVNLLTRYYWTGINECDIDIAWEVWYKDSNDSQYIRYETDLTADAFNQEAVMLTVANINIIDIYDDTTNILYLQSKEGNTFAYTFLDNDSKEVLSSTDERYNPQHKLHISNINIPIDIGFKYFYSSGNENNTNKYSVNTTITDTNNPDAISKIITLPKKSKYDNNVIFNKDGLNKLIDDIKKYPVIDITPASTSQGEPGIQILHGDNNKTKIITVGSNVKFYDTSSPPTEVSPSSISITSPTDGTIIAEVNGQQYQVPVAGWESHNINNYIRINQNSTGLFVPNSKISASYATISPWVQIAGPDQDTTDQDSNDAATNPNLRYGSQKYFWRSDGIWSNRLEGSIQIATEVNAATVNATETVNAKRAIFSSTSDASETTINTVALITGNATGQHLEFDGNEILSKSDGVTRATLYVNGSHAYYETISGSTTPVAVFKSTRVYNAVFNDYAEYRTTIDLTPGHVIIDNDDGSLSCTTARLQPGAQVISDTFGTSMGETDDAKTPIAVAGRVLVYTYQPRENYHAGMAVCSAPDGTVDIMTREEIRDYPDCIVGIVSEIPEYEEWGSANVKVDGRIWIKVK